MLKIFVYNFRKKFQTIDFLLNLKKRLKNIQFAFNILFKKNCSHTSYNHRNTVDYMVNYVVKQALCCFEDQRDKCFREY